MNTFDQVLQLIPLTLTQTFLTDAERGTELCAGVYRVEGRVEAVGWPQFRGGKALCMGMVWIKKPLERWGFLPRSVQCRSSTRQAIPSCSTMDTEAVDTLVTIRKH